MDNRDRPNIVWIMCDQMKYDAAGFGGSPIVKTPNLDRLAESGACFERAYCASPVCSPARASWLTGLYPHAHMQLRNYGPIRGRTYGSHLPDCTTIGDILKQDGYRCGMVGPWHLGDDHLPQHGFEDCWETYRYLGPDHPDPLVDYFEREGVKNLYGSGSPKTQHGNTLGFTTLSDPRQQRTTWTVDRAISFLDQVDSDPFFLFLSVKDPHPLMVVPPELLELYPVDEMPVPETLRDSFEGKPGYHSTGKFRIPPTVTDDQFREMVAYYYALVTHIDAQVGRLLNAMHERSLEDNTIFVFMSDHGELLGEHGYTEKCLMYESSVRVPLIVSWPVGISAGRRVNNPLGGVDLMPTLLDLAGSSVPDDIDGRSVADTLREGCEPEQRPVFAEIAGQQAIYHGSEEPDQFAAHVMAVDGLWKFVWNRFDTDELYDRSSDPNEMNNLIDAECHQVRVKAMRQQIREMVGKTGPGPYAWCS